MPKLTNQQLQKRKLEMAARSRQSIARKELVQFRLDAERIVKLYEIAADKGMLMGTMLRQWVIERMDNEQALGEKHVDLPATRSNRNTANLAQEVAKLSQQLSTLKVRLDKIEKLSRKKRKTNAM